MTRQATLFVGMLLAVVLSLPAIARDSQSPQGRARPILPPTAAIEEGETLKERVVGLWEGEVVYSHEDGYFLRTYISVRFTSSGTYRLIAGPIEGPFRRGEVSSVGEYRVLGSGIMMSGTGGLQFTLHDVTASADTLEFTSAGNLLLGGGVLQRQ